MSDIQKSHETNKNIWQGTTISLRTKILLGNLVIVLISVAAMGYFVFSRSKAANAFLVNQFDQSVSREIENRLAGIVSDEGNNINIFFLSMKNAIDTFGTTTGALISNEGSINLEEASWNANLKLKQLPSGSWDNSDDEFGSIFLPSSSLLGDDLAKELATLKGLDFIVQGLLKNNADITAIYFGGVAGETVYYPNIDLAAIVPPDFDITGRPWFINAKSVSQTEGKTIWSAPYQDAALNGLVITGSTPVYDNFGSFRGAVGLDLRLATVTGQVSTLRVGRTGYGFLIDSEGRVIAMPSSRLQDFNLTEEDIQSGNIENLSLINRVPLDVFKVLAKMTSGQTGVRQVSLNGSTRYIAYKPIPVIGYSLGIVVSEEELLQDFVATNSILEVETRKTIVNAFGVIFILLSVAALASYGLGTSITSPLEKLTRIAKQVAAGNLDATAEVTTRDEIGILGNTLNNMSATARNLISNLENIVNERTRSIEIRVSQIHAAAEVGKAVAAQSNLDEILNLTTQLISSRFGFYHVGIFLIDPRGEYAILMAANSSGGKKMLERQHKLKVGAEGIVGTAASSAEARIVLDVGEDTVYFDNPDLPQTCSEMALPLIAGGEVLGVLDIQSLEANAFTADDIPTLQIIADQLAIALQNARLLHETQEALLAAQKAMIDISQHGWQEMQKEIGSTGYVGLVHGEVVRVTEEIDEDTLQVLKNGNYVISEDRHTLIVPVVVRGKTIGMLRLTKPTQIQPWLPDEVSNIQSLSDQISNALENARFYRSAQRRATREHVISEISARIGSSTNMDEILRTAAEELGRRMRGTEVIIELGADFLEEQV